jgi:hypothetical protein
MSAQPIFPFRSKGSSLRRIDVIRDLMRSAEGRALSEDEIRIYLSAAPEQGRRVDAYRDLLVHQDAVVEKTVLYIFSNYPFAKFKPESEIKCPRDVGLVATYAGHAMLMNDPDWYRDKLLLWLRTMLQSFYFPRRVAAERKTLFGTQSTDAAIERVPQRVQAIRETYTTLRSNFEAVLKPASFELLGPYLQQAADTLSAE